MTGNFPASLSDVFLFCRESTLHLGEALAQHADVNCESLPAFLGGKAMDVPRPQVVPTGAHFAVARHAGRIIGKMLVNP